MFSTRHIINNISLLLIAFTNSLLILTVSNEFRTAAFIFFLAYLIIFPGLSLINAESYLVGRKFLIYLLGVTLIILLVVLFTFFDASGILPALVFISFWAFLQRDSENVTELLIRTFLFMSAPVIILEIVLNGTTIAASLLLVIIIYMQAGNNGTINFTFYFFSVLSGALLVVSPTLLIPYAFFILFIFRDNLLRLILFCFITAIAFTFVVFIVSEGMMSEYLNYYFNSSLLFIQPEWLSIIYVITLLYAAWITADLQEVYFTSGLFIAVPILIFFIINVVNSGIDGLRAYNYLNTLQISIALFIPAIKDYKVGHFTGRIFPVSTIKSS